jgi:hypothetical protein
LVEERGACCESTAALGTIGRTCERGRDVLVRFECRLTAVPRFAVGIDFRVRGVREGAMDGSPLVARSRPIARRAHKGVPEPDECAEFEQALLHDSFHGVPRDAEALRSPLDERRVADRLRRRYEHQSSRVQR